MCPRRTEDKGGLKNSMEGYVTLIRPVNAAMMAFAVLVGAVLAEGGWPGIGADKLLAGMATGFLLLGSAMVFNDYADLEVDVINAPWRPIPSGLVSPRAAMLYASMLGAAGLATSLYTGPATFILALASLATSLLYDFWGKKTGLPGNLMVSFNVAMPIAYGAALTSRIDPDIAVFWLMVFLANTGREIIKGIADVRGDSARGIRTLAATRGSYLAAWAAATLILSAVMLSPLPYICGEASRYYLVVVLADLGFLHASISIVRDPSPRNARRVKNRMLLYMMLGLLAFLLARIA